MRVRVKICGIRTLEEALVAAGFGADLLGFNFWPRSPRYIEPVAAAEIICRLPEQIETVGVFVNEDREAVSSIARNLELDAVQLHGDESPEYCGSLEDPPNPLPLGTQTIKAFRVGAGFDPHNIATYRVDMALLDASVKGAYGGTGRPIDWKLAIEAKDYAPIILAGGLDAANVADAIRTVLPAAVDVCSGVEAEPGKKDIVKLRQFLDAVGLANDSLTAGD